MVKVLYLGLFAAIVCAFAAPVPNNTLQHRSRQLHPFCNNGSHCQQQEVTLADDGTVRSERSTNLSHITGSARKIRMFVKNWQLQVLPDGVVNGTADDSSDYTILQRTTVNIGLVKIQGVATCQYLCMDRCGLLYASKDFLDECIFNETIRQHHYNMYSSVRYSNARRTMYLALNRFGQPRRVQIRGEHQLGKLSTYANVLTKTVSIERVEELLTKIGNATGSQQQHPLRHHGGLQTCTAIVEQKNEPQSSDWQGVDKLRCRKRKKRKKKRRKCDKQDGSTNSDECFNNNNNNNNNKKKKNNNNFKSVKNSDKPSKQCAHDNSKKCQRLGGKSDLQLVLVKKKKKQKQLNANKKNQNGGKKTLRLNNRKIVKKVLPVFEAEDTTEDLTTTIQNGDDVQTIITSESIEESSIDESTTAPTSAMEDSEQNYDDMASSTNQPSGEMD